MQFGMLKNEIKYLGLIGFVDNHRQSSGLAVFTELLFIKEIVTPAGFKEYEQNFVIFFEQIIDFCPARSEVIEPISTNMIGVTRLLRG